ncbi:MAG TPA: hypothetical protein VLF43_00490 [Candidatus Saccharimonadales bacterium]|nr:hypothetical protein [Candidatus Saccharimonadales bacterium]
MSVARVLVLLATGLALLCSILALVVFAHEFVGVGGGPLEVVHNLEVWLMTVGYHTALILLAATGVAYLGRKL